MISYIQLGTCNQLQFHILGHYTKCMVVITTTSKVIGLVVTSTSTKDMELVVITANTNLMELVVATSTKIMGLVVNTTVDTKAMEAVEMATSTKGHGAGGDYY